MDTEPVRREPRPDPDAPPVAVRVAIPWWDSGDPYEVTLHPVFSWFKPGTKHAPTAWEVYAAIGDDPMVRTWVGTVGRYEGSIDTKIPGTRLRRVGKRRILWSKQEPDWDSPMYEQVSRADVIRSLVETARRAARA